MTHPIISDLQNRYTAKHYDPSKKISKQDLDVIYQAIQLSASSINSQPWKFIVIESDEAKQRFSKTFANKFQFNQKHATQASHIILFAHNPAYKKEDYDRVIAKDIEIGRIKQEDKEQAFGAYMFAELNTDETGYNGNWTKAQTYIALGNTLHTLARLGIDSTTMEGIDSELIGEIFKDELDGYVCDVALAMGYHDANTDYNKPLPKSRLDQKDIIRIL